MGKLAERLGDAARSGVYRVEVTDALEEAAALNGFVLERVSLEGGPDGACERALAACADGRVLVFTGFERLARNAPALARLVGALEAACAAHRAGGLRLFAVFVDPAARLSLAPLYKWR